MGGCRHTSPRPASHAELSAGSHSRRTERAGDLVAFDTDLIGSYGFCADLSRTWLCGGGAPSNEQAELFAISSEQIGHNSGLIRPGVSFRDLVEGSKVPPPDCFPARYGVLYHGVGLADAEAQDSKRPTLETHPAARASATPSMPCPARVSDGTKRDPALSIF